MALLSNYGRFVTFNVIESYHVIYESSMFMVYLQVTFCLQVITLAPSTVSVPNTRGEINGFLPKRLAILGLFQGL